MLLMKQQNLLHIIKNIGNVSIQKMQQTERDKKLYYQKLKDYVINRKLINFYKIKNGNCTFDLFLAYEYLITVYTF